MATVQLPYLGWRFPWLIAAFWLLTSLVGYRVLGVAWRTAQVEEFKRSVQSAAELAAVHRWSEPLESDAAWHALEERLGLDLVPIDRPALDRNQSSDVSWLKSPDGYWRASVMVPVGPGLLEGRAAHAAKTGGEIAAIRGTRVFKDHGVDAVWWCSWSIGWLCVWAVQGWRWKRDFGFESAYESSAPSSVTEPPKTQAGNQPYGLERLAVNYLHEGLLLVDQHSRIVLINKALCRQLELAPSDIEGRLLVEVIRVPRIIELLEQVTKTRQAGEERVEVTQGARTLLVTATPVAAPSLADGVSDSATPAASLAGGGVLMTAQDISSSQRSELARREFIAGASHELKTPLAAIRAYTETLQAIGQDDPDATGRFLSNILDQADRMDRLVSSMLQLARAESGAMKLKLERIDPAAAIRPCIEAAQGMAQPKGLTVTANMPPQRILIQSDRDALQTIASNLLSNAVRYTQPGGRIDIALSLETTAPEGVRLPSSPASAGAMFCLRVSDTGLGISAADQMRIFERFYRVQKDRALDSGGTGLGLAIVKQLTEVLGGCVLVSSRPGEGTRFEIWLPAVGFTQSS